MNETKTKLMITKKYLDQLYGSLGIQLEVDVKQYDMDNKAGEIRITCLAKIAECKKNIDFELQQIENCISLAEDMEKGLKNG